MTAVVSKSSFAAVAGAIEGSPVEYWRMCAPHLAGVEHYDEPELMRFITGIPFAPFNQVVLTQLAREDVDTNIDETLALCSERGVPMLWSVNRSTQPADLGASLEAHGLTNAGTMSGMAVDLGELPEADPPPAGLLLERVRDTETLAAWRHAYTNSFEMPEFAGWEFFRLYSSMGFDEHAPFRHYVGLLDGEPVASSTLFLGAETAGIWHVGTLPAVRRRGIGAAMTLAPLLDARAIGYQTGTVYSAASEMGLNIYRQLGFREYCGVTQYLWVGAS